MLKVPVPPWRNGAALDNATGSPVSAKIVQPDPNLVRVLHVWPSLSAAAKSAVLALIEAATRS